MSFGFKYAKGKERTLLSYFSPKIKEFDRDTSTGVSIEFLVMTVLSVILVKQNEH